MMWKQKINMDNYISWDFHRSGWKFVVYEMYQNFHSPSGIKFISHFETNVAHGNPIKSDWVGFVHNTPRHHPEMEKYKNFNCSLGVVSKSKTWLESKPYCRGLFVLSNYIKEWVIDNMHENVCMLYHPTEFVNLNFNFDSFIGKKTKKVFFIGHWMRNFKSFEKLKCDYEKIMLTTQFHEKEPVRKENSGITFKSHVEDEIYDKILSKNLVFLDLYDASANNVVIECIVRNNPIVVRRLRGVEEYIGKDYPLFFETLEEAEYKISNYDLIYKGHNYLKQMNKSFLTFDKFLKEFNDSKIYSEL